jgi:hypothetical protein
MTQVGPKRDVGRRAVDTLLDVLPRSAEVHEAERDSDADLVVGDQPLDIRWAGEGSLGDVRPLVTGCGGRPVIVAARRLSPGAREALTAAGIGWVDESGAAEIAVGSIIVSRTGHPPKPAERPRRWTPAVMAVAEALLCGTKGTVSATEVATGLSTGSCTNALRTLTELGLLVASSGRGRGSGRRLADPNGLLDAYATAVDASSEPISLQIGVTWRDPVAGLVATGRKWDNAGVAWVSTGAAAASVIAPYLATVTSSEVYVDAGTFAGLEARAADVGLRPIEGGRLTLRPFPTVAVRRFAEEVEGLRVAPWPRVYADLRTTGVRGEEAAEHLREVSNAR